MLSDGGIVLRSDCSLVFFIGLYDNGSIVDTFCKYEYIYIKRIMII